jgi:hypothetical protein
MSRESASPDQVRQRARRHAARRGATKKADVGAEVRSPDARGVLEAQRARLTAEGFMGSSSSSSGAPEQALGSEKVSACVGHDHLGFRETGSPEEQKVLRRREGKHYVEQRHYARACLPALHGPEPREQRRRRAARQGDRQRHRLRASMPRYRGWLVDAALPDGCVRGRRNRARSSSVAVRRRASGRRPASDTRRPVPGEAHDLGSVGHLESGVGPGRSGGHDDARQPNPPQLSSNSSVRSRLSVSVPCRGGRVSDSTQPANVPRKGFFPCTLAACSRRW